MRKLRVRLSESCKDSMLNRFFKSREGFLVEIDRETDVCGDFPIKIETDDGKRFKCTSDMVDILDLEGVPEAYMKSPILQRVWVFTTARNDAYYKGPPSDPVDYRERYGVDYTDTRVYDVKAWSYTDSKMEATWNHIFDEKQVSP